MTDAELEEWSDNAAALGDTETMLIAEIALGHQIDIESYTLTPEQRREIGFMTRDRARKIAETW